jgi:Predicted sulfurtransferase
MYHVAALYKFTELKDPDALKDRLLPEMKARKISGTLIFANEGVNGTVAGSKEALDWLIGELHQKAGLTPEDIKWSTASEQPFKRTKIKIKPEIVTLREDGVDAANNTGEFVTPDQWNTLLEDPETVVIDTRNFYETEIGT